MLKNITKKRVIILFTILSFVYAVWPVNIALKPENISKSKNYLIVEIYATIDIDFHILYDSQNRDIQYIKDDDRVKNSFLHFNGFKNDYMGNLNKYVIYTDAQNIEYSLNGNTLHISDYSIKILYPVRRNKSNSIYPNGCVLRFEQWFEM